MSSENSINIYKPRIDKIVHELEEHDLGIHIIFKYEDIFYLTGFYGKDSNSILIISKEKVFLLVNFIYFEDAEISIRDPGIEVILYKDDRIKRTAEILNSLKSKKITLECSGVDHLSFTKLEKELKKSGKRLVLHKGMVKTPRSIKDGYEIRNIMEACKITDLAFEEILNLPQKIIQEYSELSLGAEIERLLIEKGGYGRSFDFVIAAGKNSSRPHYIAGHRKIKNGLLLMDFGTVYNNYCSDITRTLFVANRSSNDKLRKIYDIVLNAQQKAIEACREGISCGELDSIAREYIREQGYGEEFGHGLGHGVGLEVHEGPIITKNNKTILKENMVITIEPGIYIPGLGGIRIEDMLVVKKNGCENLYNSKKEFTITS